MTLRALTEGMGLTEPPRRVWVVEDHVGWLTRLAEFWREMGHEVVEMQGVARIEDGIAYGPGRNAEEEVSVALDTVDAAFLDHYFLSRTWNGTTLTGELDRRGRTKIFAMSSDAGANARMRAVGAHFSARKSELMRLFG